MLEQQFESLERRAADALDALRHYRARLQELETRLAESEATRLELAEENRELDEQNRELEEDNARLRERLRKGEPAPVFPGPARRAQGLAALIGQRSSEPEMPPTDRPEAAHSNTEPEAAHTNTEPETARSNTEPEAARSNTEPEAAQDEPKIAHAEPEQVAATNDERQGRLAIEQAPSAEALLKQWYQRYPNTFFKGHTRPLKVGIHHELAQHEPWPEKLLRRALAGYVNLPRYLKAVREGAERIDLEGRPAGSVDAQAAEYAKRKLERLQNAQRERGQKRPSGDKRGNGKPKEGAATASTKAARLKHEARRKPAPTDMAAAKPMSMEEKLAALQAKHGGKR